MDGVVPFPPEFAKRYREKGYWRDLSLAEELAPVFRRYAKRVAVIDRDARITYAEIDRVSDRLALNLLDAGLAPLDRVVVQLPNVVEFPAVCFALLRLGVLELVYLDVPAAVTINEAVDLAKQYSTADSGRFVNGILGRIAREAAAQV